MRARPIALLAVLVALLITPALARAAAATPPSIGAPTAVPGASALSAIACPSATTCEALGTTSVGAPAVVSIADGVPARAVPVPTGASGDQLTLDALACQTATTCEAVGALTDAGGDTSAAVVTITRGRPSGPVTAADSEAADGDAPSLTGVACPSATSCEAVGVGNDAVATEIVDGAPSALSHDQDAEIGQLSGIACADGSCDALGSGTDGNGIVVPVSGGNLGASSVVAGTTALTLAGCAPGGSCEVLGTDAGGHGVLVPDAHGSFGTPVTAGSDQLTSVACETSSTCVATGATSSSAGVLVGIDRGAVGAATPAPFGPTAQVACASATECLVAGSMPAGGASITEIGPAVDAVSLNVGAARTHGTTVTLRLTCATQCSGAIAEAAALGSGRHARLIVVGRAPFSLPATTTRTIAVRLDAAGRRLLASRHRLSLQLAVSTRMAGRGTVVAIRSATIGHARAVKRKRPVKKKRR